MAKDGYVTRVSGDFSTYDEALQACPSALYANEEVSFEPRRYEKVLKKLAPTFKRPLMASISSRLTPYLVANSFFNPNDLKILDVGGGDARFFHWQRAVYGDQWSPTYHVLEAPSVAAFASSQPKPFEIAYFDDPQQLSDRYSYIVFGSMLSIMRDPWDFFDKVLDAAKSDLIVITNFPLMPRQPKDRLGIKDLQKRSHPYWLFGAEGLTRIRRHGNIVLQTLSNTHAFEVGRRTYPQRNIIVDRLGTVPAHSRSSQT